MKNPIMIFVILSFVLTSTYSNPVFAQEDPSVTNCISPIADQFCKGERGNLILYGSSVRTINVCNAENDKYETTSVLTQQELIDGKQEMLECMRPYEISDDSTLHHLNFYKICCKACPISRYCEGLPPTCCPGGKLCVDNGCCLTAKVCKVSGNEEKICCERNDTCHNYKGKPICCDPDLKPCGGDCCLKDRCIEEKDECCPGTKVPKSGICCEPNEKNCSGRCCKTDKCINDKCCTEDEIDCGGTCCPQGRCAGVGLGKALKCCPEEQVPCGGGGKCGIPCGNGCCWKDNQVCDDDAKCVDSDKAKQITTDAENSLK